MTAYDTLSDAVKGLRERGFTLDFNLDENCLVCHQGRFGTEEFEITEVYRFEGDTDPSDESVVYAIESNTGLKGLLVNGYGISSEPMSDAFVAKLRIRKP